MPIVRGQFDQLLVPGARKVYVDEYEKLPAFYPQFFNIDTSGRSFEEEMVTTGLPIAVEKPEGEEIAFDRPKFRGKVRFTHSTFGLGYEITREAVEDELYGVLTNQGSTNLAWSFREAEEVTAWSVVNGAFSTILSYDGVPLISTAHLGTGSMTFSNRANPDVDFSTNALQAMLEHFMTLRTDRNMRVSMMPTDLWVSPYNWILVNEILKAQFRPTAAGGSMGDETPNIVSSEAGITPHWIPYITDTDAWFATSPKSGHTFKYFWRRQPDEASGSDERAQIAWYGMTGRWSAGVVDWRHIYGTPGA